MDKKAAWFSHDSNAQDDENILAMRAVYKSEGYGWYWIIVEMMRDANAYRLQCDRKYWAFGLAKKMDCTPEKAQEFIHDCIHEFNLFVSNGSFFWSESLNRRMDIKDGKSLTASKSAKSRWEKEKLMQSERNANASKQDAENMLSKVKISKEEEGLSLRLIPRMITAFREEYPGYPIDSNKDMTACLEISKKIEDLKGWHREASYNGQLENCLAFWKEIVGWTKTNKWYSTKDISFIEKDFQSVIQSMNAKGTKAQSKIHI